MNSTLSTSAAHEPEGTVASLCDLMPAMAVNNDSEHLLRLDVLMHVIMHIIISPYGNLNIGTIIK